MGFLPLPPSFLTECTISSWVTLSSGSYSSVGTAEMEFNMKTSTALRLTTEAVQSSSLMLQSVYGVRGSHGLPFRVFGVGDSIANNVLKEDLQHTTSFFVDQAFLRDAPTDLWRDTGSIRLRPWP